MIKYILDVYASINNLTVGNFRDIDTILGKKNIRIVFQIL